MMHLWLRAEHRPTERRAPLTPDGAARLVAAGARLSVEESAKRVFAASAYASAGAEIVPEGSWREAPADALILGLKELPEDGQPLRHRHIMFGHAFKGQPAGRELLARFGAGGGTLLDLEYLTDAAGRRVAAFGYWAGYAGAALSLLALAAQRSDGVLGAVDVYEDAAALADLVRARLGEPAPRALIAGALGRVGQGAAALLAEAGVTPTRWDIAETEGRQTFPEVLEHEVFLNCILARPGAPLFVPAEAAHAPRALRVIGDIACDPTAPFSPVQVYDRPTEWQAPVIRVADDPPLDVMAIDNLPSLLPRESTEDFAAQLLSHLLALPDGDVWERAEATFQLHLSALEGAA